MKRTACCAVLLLAGILFVGCDRDPGGVSHLTSPTAPTVARPGSAPSLSLLDELDYEVISGTLTPGQSGVMSQNLKTWDKNCLFSLVVPASSMPDEGPPINYTMSIPTKASYLQHPEELFQWLVIRLAPDGEQFLGPITVQGTWMPWQGVPPETLWVYSPGDTDSTLATITYVPNINRYRVTFQVNHFSDWETGPGPRRDEGQ